MLEQGDLFLELLNPFVQVHTLSDLAVILSLQPLDNFLLVDLRLLKLFLLLHNLELKAVNTVSLRIQFVHHFSLHTCKALVLGLFKRLFQHRHLLSLLLKSLFYL